MSLKKLDNTILGNSSSIVTSGKATGKSVLEKLKTLSQNAATSISTTSNDALDELNITVAPGESSQSPLLMLRYVLAFLLVLFILLNILAAFGLLPNVLEDFFKPILVFFGHSVGETVRQTTDISAEGSKAVIDATSKTIDGAIDILEQKVNSNQNEDEVATTNALDHAEQNQKRTNSPEPDEAGSRTQQYKSSGKAGYCYIGEDRGFRSCIEVEKDDECMSGKIFPSQDICINPTLRQ